MTEREALKLALEALENWFRFDFENFGEVDYKAVAAIKEALAQPEQEPVGWAEHGVINWLADKQFNHTSYLYDTPAQRTWVGLTDGEVESLQRLAIDPVDANGWGFLNRERYAHLIEAKLRSKNNK